MKTELDDILEMGKNPGAGSCAADRPAEGCGEAPAIGGGALFPRMLVAVDFSDASEAALHLAGVLAGRCGGRIHTVHLTELPSAGYEFGSTDFDLLAGRMRKIAERQLDEWVSKSMPGGTKATCEVRYGWPFGGRKAYREIVEAAIAWKADLVVVGATGAGKMDRFVLGSTAERVLRSSHSPVLVVPEGTGTRLKNIFVPVDFSVPAEPVLEMAGVLAAAFGARLCLFHAIEPLASLRTLSELGLLHSDEEAAVRLHGQLETLAAASIGRGIPVRCEVRIGKPAAEIVAAAARADADLILVPGHVRSGWKRAVLGSTAERVVRHAHRPVLVVPGAGRFTEPLNPTSSFP